MKIKNKILTTAFLIVNSFSVLAEDGGNDSFSGCIGKDVTGREVKVESLSRSLENCPFAKVYLKENEEKYKSEIDTKVSDALKTSLDQDLETLMLQGEFFNSLGINLLNYGDNENIKANCKLDKMTDLSTCSGKNSKEYERRKKSLLEKFGAKNEVEFSQKIKDKFKRMTGRSVGNTCPLISNNEKDLDQFILYQSSFTKASLLSLKEYLKEKNDTVELQAKFPMLDLIFKGDEKVAQKFIEEIKELDESKGENVLAALIKDKIKNFYGQKENAKSISATMAKTCDEFNKKITKFICSDELNYEAQNATLSRRLFDGFDMSEADLSRNRRVKLQDKEMAFMAFGKKCEINEREDRLVVTQNRLTLDKLIGAEGEYVKGLRGNISEDLMVGSRSELKETAFCQTPDLKSKNLCSNSLPLSAAKLRETYNCPDSESCKDSIELAANYLEGCEKREVRNKLLAQSENTSGNNEAGNGSGTSVERKDPLDLDFFDNLLENTKTPIAKSIELNKENTKLGAVQSNKSGKLASDLYAPKKDKDVKKQDDFRETNQTNFGTENTFNSIQTTSAESTAKTLGRTGTKRKDSEVSNQLNNGSQQNKVLNNSNVGISNNDSVSKENAELSARLASLEGQFAGEKKGYEKALQDAKRKKTNEEERLASDSNKNKRIVKKDNSIEFDGSVYRNNQNIANNENIIDGSMENVNENTTSKGIAGGGNETSKIGSKSSAVLGKGAGIALNSQSGKKEDVKEGKDLIPTLVINLEELGAMDELKLNQMWKDKNSKFVISVKGEKNLDEKMILSLDKDRKPTIDNFQSLSLKTRESVLKSKLFKDFKIIRQKELNEVMMKAI